MLGGGTVALKVAPRERSLVPHERSLAPSRTSSRRLANILSLPHERSLVLVLSRMARIHFSEATVLLI